MKKFVLLIYFVICAITVMNGQNWKWSNQLECTGSVKPLKVITDNSMEIFT